MPVVLGSYEHDRRLNRAPLDHPLPRSRMRDRYAGAIFEFLGWVSRVPSSTPEADSSRHA